MGALNAIDITVIAGFFLIIFLISAYYARQAGKDTGSFFLSGRNLPWYLAGTAMVATTFAADTPLAVTELIAINGVSGNWVWWNMAIGGMLTVFFFAKLWRRAGIMTDLEFIEMRYEGKPAAFLRGFRAIYLGLLLNAIILGWVHKAMEKIFLVTFPDANAFLWVSVLAVVIGIYASMSGLLGTSRTDSFQFVFALIGCIILAVIVVELPEVGGLSQLKAKIAPEVINFFPEIQASPTETLTGGVLSLTIGAFLAFIGLQWWASWYPGADPGGGGYIAQRMMSAKDEKNSLLATLWFNIAHYTLRPWPWILVALAALIILPRAADKNELETENAEWYAYAQNKYELKLQKTDEVIAIPAEVKSDPAFDTYYEKYENTIDPGLMYPKLMIRYLPPGLLGLLIAVFLAAYMSTISSQLNWGTSYIINDFYKRFVRKGASEKHYVIVSKLGMLVMVIFSLLITKYFLTTVSGAWIFIINASAGLGGVLILRWYWWRVNAWSEIAAMVAPLIIYPISLEMGFEPPYTMYPTVFGSTVVWVVVTFITDPISKERLIEFYKKTYPGGIGWKAIANEVPDVPQQKSFGKLFLSWILGVFCIYSAMYGTGMVIFGEYLQGFIALGLTVIAAIVIFRNFD